MRILSCPESDDFGASSPPQRLGLGENRAVVRFDTKRGTAEQWIKEGKQAVKMTRLSCHRFRSNEVRLWLSLLAYNLGNLWRRLGLPRGIENWSLTSLQQRLVKTGGRLVKHARYYWLLLAEGHLEPAAVRGDVGPDRSAPGINGIERWVGRVCIGNRPYQKAGRGGVLQKQGARWGDSGRAGADGGPPGVLR